MESLRIMIGSVGIFDINLSFESASGLRDIKTVECRRPTLLVLDFTPARNPMGGLPLEVCYVYDARVYCHA